MCVPGLLPWPRIPGGPGLKSAVCRPALFYGGLKVCQNVTRDKESAPDMAPEPGKSGFSKSSKKKQDQVPLMTQAAPSIRTAVKEGTAFSSGFSAGASRSSVDSGVASVMKNAVSGFFSLSSAWAERAVDFDTVIQETSRLMQAGPEGAQRLSDLAIDTARSGEWSPVQIGQALHAAGQSGMVEGQAAASLPGALLMAQAGNMVPADAMALSATIQNRMPVDPSDMTRMATMLVQTAGDSARAVPLLGQALATVGPDAVAGGASLEQVTAMLGVLAEASLEGEKAGLALGHVISGLADPSSDVASLLQAMDIGLRDASGQMRSVPDVLGDLGQAMAGLDTSGREQLTGRLFGTDPDTFKAGSALISSAGAGQLQARTEQLATVTPVASLQGADLDTLDNRFQRLINKADAFAMALGSMLMPWIRPLMEVVATIREVAKVVGLFTDACAVLRAVGTLVCPVFNVLTGIMRVIGTTLMGLGPVLNIVALGIRAIGIAMMANPVGLVITAIALAAGLLIAHWEPVVAFFSDLWSGLSDGAAAAWDAICSLVMEKVKWLTDVLAPVFTLFGFGETATQVPPTLPDTPLPGSQLTPLPSSIPAMPPASQSAELERSVAAIGRVAPATAASRTSTTHHVTNANTITINAQPHHNPQDIVDEMERRQKQRSRGALYDSTLVYEA